MAGAFAGGIEPPSKALPRMTGPGHHDRAFRIWRGRKVSICTRSKTHNALLTSTGSYDSAVQGGAPMTVKEQSRPGAV